MENSQTPLEEEELDDEEPHPRGIPPMQPRYQLKLVSPLSWQVLDTFTLPNSERVLCGCAVELRDVTPPQGDPAKGAKGAQMNTRTLIAIGTGFVHSEDVAMKGRLILFEIAKQAINTEKENGQIILFWEKNNRGPASAMAELEGHLIVNIGPKILVHRWSHATQDLVPCAFHDSQIYAVSIRTLKNFIIIGDIHKSVHFYIWMDRSPRTLKLLATDFSRLEVLACEFIAMDTTVCFTVSDSHGNVRVFQYSKKYSHVDTVEQLILTGGINVGGRVNSFLRMQMLPFSGEDPQATRRLRLCNVYATLDGAIGFLCPLDERNYKRLYMLQMRLIDAIAHYGGLHPRAFRVCKPQFHPNYANVHNIIDGDLVAQYNTLSISLQEELAKSIATSSRRIKEALFDFNRGTMFF